MTLASIAKQLSALTADEANEWLGRDQSEIIMALQANGSNEALHLLQCIFDNDVSALTNAAREYS